MNDWIIKRFRELDLDELYEIIRSRSEVFIQEQKIIDEEDLDGIDNKCIHVFIKKEDRVAAYCRIIPKEINNEYVSVGRVLVLKKYRRSGLAEEMISIACNHIRDVLREEKIIISAQLYVKSLYEKIGFTLCSETYDEAGIPHIKMCRNM